MSPVNTLEDVGDRNRRNVLSEILLHGPVSRNVIAERVGLTAASVSRITRSLIDNGLIEEGEHFSHSPGRGRKSIGLSIRPNGGYLVGISINVFSQDIVIADLANGEVAHRHMRFDSLADANEVLATCSHALVDLLQSAAISQELLIGCSVVIAGAIDPDSLTLRASPVLGWYDIDVESVVKPILDVPLMVESIANAKARSALCFGSAKGARNMVLANCSLGINASIYMDGNLLRGFDSNAGLIDSMLIPAEQSGDLKLIENIAGGFGVINASLEQSGASAKHHAGRLVDMICLANDGNQQAIERLEQAGRALGWFVAQTNFLLHPEQFLISGPMIDSDAYCAGIRSRLVELVDEQFVSTTLRFFRISNQAAAHSLAVYHFLISGEQQQEDQLVSSNLQHAS